MSQNQIPVAHTVSPTPVRASYRNGTYLIRVQGTLAESACSELEDILAHAEASDAKRILLDLDRLKSLDARALHAILRASRRSIGNGNRLKVTRGRGHVANIFRLTALDRTLPFVDEEPPA